MPSRPKRPSPRLIRGELWVESGGKRAMTPAGADLLEQIAICGSLSEAARRLRYSYRRAWMLLNAMNRHWPAPLVKTAAGGRKGGGAQVTEYGHRVLRTFRDLQFQLEHMLDTAADPFARL